MAKLTDCQRRTLRIRGRSGCEQRTALATEYNVSPAYVTLLCNGRHPVTRGGEPAYMGELLRRLREGETLTDAAVSVGRTRATVYGWREARPDLWTRVCEARASAKGDV